MPRSKYPLNIFLFLIIASIGFYFFSLETFSIFQNLNFPRNLPANNGSGKIDFIEYWTAFRLFLAGESPYQPQAMLALQSQLRPTVTPLMMWNPPWLMVILGPLLALNFSLASILWFAINLIFWWFSLLFIVKAFDLRGPIPWIFGVINSPALMTLRLGQVSLLMLFGLAAALYLLAQQAPFRAGAALILLTIKPHLLYLGFALGAVLLYREKWWGLVFGLVVALVVLCGLSEIIAPGVLQSWRIVVTQPQEIVGAINVAQWVPATAVGALQMLVNSAAAIFGLDFSSFSGSLRFIIPGVTIVVCGHYLLANFKSFKVGESIVLGIALSLATSPFGWHFDHVLLTIPIMWLANFLAQRGAWLLLATLMAVQILPLILLRYYIKFQHELFWYPISICLLLGVIIRCLAPSPPKSC